MDYVIEDVGRMARFWEYMPETYQGFGYELEGDWDYDAEKFQPKYFQLYDEAHLVQEGFCPEDLLQYVKLACKKVVDALEAEGLLQDEDEYTYDDYLADKADKEYYERD